MLMFKDHSLGAILLGALFISFSSVWVVWAGLVPTVSAFYRVFFGAAILLFSCLLAKDFSLPHRRSLPLLIICSLSFAGDLVCWHASIGYIGPGLSTIIGNFQVFILTFISIVFYKERATVQFLISVPLAVFGLFLIVGFNWHLLPESYLFGLFLALMTALLYSVFILSLRHLQAAWPEVSPLNNLMAVSVGSSILLFPAVYFSADSFAIPSLSSLGSLLGLALFSQTIGWLLITSNLPKVLPSIAGLLLLLQPALAFVWDYLLFDRPTTLLNWSGVALVLAAIYLGMSSPRANMQTAQKQF